MSGRGLASARALIVGAGGLGCPAAIVLARAGVGTIAVCDDDVVEVANLHRQILHRSSDAGLPKVDSAAAAIRRIAPSVTVIPIRDRLGAENALALVRGYDVVLDGSDNFATKFLVNDACVLAGVPFVHAGAVRWGGQLLAVRPGSGGPCYRCLFEAPPPSLEGFSCREAGVVGPAVGVIGALQGEAALKLLNDRLPLPRAGEGRGEGETETETETGLVVYDGLSGSIREVRFHRNPLCAACGRVPLRALDPGAYQEAAC
ncbi:MAG: HesA/MoeB/ThiF family protein [Myxococcales bacterium]|nr:HesA/MoeB/ThiF family protein [Myxococcales bacterium]